MFKIYVLFLICLSCPLLLLFYIIFFSCFPFLFLSFFRFLVKQTNSTTQKQMKADWTSSGRSTKTGKRTEAHLMSSGRWTKNRKRTEAGLTPSGRWTKHGKLTLNPKRQSNGEEKTETKEEEILETGRIIQNFVSCSQPVSFLVFFLVCVIVFSTCCLAKLLLNRGLTPWPTKFLA